MLEPTSDFCLVLSSVDFDTSLRQKPAPVKHYSDSWLVWINIFVKDLYPYFHALKKKQAHGSIKAHVDLPSYFQPTAFSETNG